MRRSNDRMPERRNRDWEITPYESGFFGPSTLFSISPWQAMRRMQDDMDRLFDQIVAVPNRTVGGQPGGLAQAAQQWAPSIDISQSDREWCIEADLPGVNKDNVNVEVRDHHLIIQAEMRSDTEPEGSSGSQGEPKQYHRRERRYGYFQRVVPLPENVREEEITCDYRDGVLAVHVPKTAESQRGPRRIPIRSIDQLPAETATGRKRTPTEMSMTTPEDDEEEMDGRSGRGREVALAGSKGGETRSQGTPKSSPGSSGTSGKTGGSSRKSS